VPVVSTGGGAFTELGGEITKILGAIAQFITYLPEHSTLQDLYNNTQLVKETIADRLQSGLWTTSEKTGNFIQKMATRSSKNLQFAQHFVKMSDKVYQYTYLTPSNYRTCNKLDVPNVTNEPFINIRVQQIRLLAHRRGQGASWHSTMLYNANRELVPYDTLIKYRDSCGIEYQAIILKAISHNGKKISVMYPEAPLFDEQDTHITLDPGAHQPKLMRNVVGAMRCGDKQIQLDGETYDLQNAKKTKTIYTYLDVFCL